MKGGEVMPNYKDFDLDLTNKKVITNEIKDKTIQANIARTYGPVKSCQYICRLSENIEDCQ